VGASLRGDSRSHEVDVSEKIRIRRASAKDLATVMHHRTSMFTDMGHADPGALEAMRRTSEPLFRRGLENGSYLGWLAEDPEGVIVAGGGIIVLEFHSHPRDPRARRAWIVNMFTEPGFRRRGLARRLMAAMIEWCREAELASVFLHASDEGRPLYESLGFIPTNEMRLDFQQTAAGRGQRVGTLGAAAAGGSG
jgi:GNAT superfamily N-acetyltransferase